MKDTPLCQFWAVVEVSIKPTKVFKEFHELRQLLTNALTIYIEHHFSVLTEDTSLKLVDDFNYVNDLNESMVAKLLESSNSSDYSHDLSRAGLLVTLNVESLYVSSIGAKNSTNCISFQEINNAIQSLDPSHIVDTQQSLEKVETSNTNIKFIFYQNVDKLNGKVDLNDFSKDSVDSVISETVIDEFDGITLNSTSNKNVSSAPSIPPQSSQYKNISNFSERNDSSFMGSVKVSVLPNSELEETWRKLKFKTDFKRNILQDMKASLNFNNSSESHLFIFHGPPGSGKSTLCKALAQKISIVHQFQGHQMTPSYVLEVSCEQIFSKWYGESSQNLVKLFQSISILADQSPSNMIFLIIDEVETLANSRSAILSKNETSDGVRVVNTFLTQLDSLKQHKNLVMFSTSNLIESIDEAFLDRADGCFIIERPSVEAINQLMVLQIQDLISAGVISDTNFSLVDTYQENEPLKIIKQLSEICHGELKISGRSLMKLLKFASKKENIQSLYLTTREPGISLVIYLKSLTVTILERLQSTN